MTDMHAAANERLAEENNVPVFEMMARRYANVALRHAGEPGDVADAVACLAGPQSAYVTGIAFPWLAEFHSGFDECCHTKAG